MNKVCFQLNESNCLRVQFKIGGIIHLRLNMNGKPIANKYRKGKLKRTLKRESKELEAVEMEAIKINVVILNESFTKGWGVAWLIFFIFN